MRAAVLVLAACLVPAGAARGQDSSVATRRIANPPRAARLLVTASIGLARRQGQPWENIHLALRGGGWDGYFPALLCTPFCLKAEDVATGRPLALHAAVRLALKRRWQLRAFAASAPLGTYPGSSGGSELRILPSARVAGVQGVWAWRGLWAALGPTINHDRVEERADTSRRATSGIRAGAAFGIGLTFPPRGATFIEVALERRIAGSLDLPAMAVPGRAPVPAMRVPLDHTLLAVGIGLRR